MQEICDIKDLHGILLEIAKTFHRICVENNIPYTMLGGTMLGAVRHKGFIPWDDDMDFGVPRESFERLKCILSEKLPEKYGVLTMDNSPALLTDILKIHDKRTIIHELYKEYLTNDFGINIDVFPLDKVRGLNRLKAKKIDFLISIEYYRFLSIKSRPFLKRILALTIKGFLFFLNRKTIINYINRHMIEKDGSFLANHYGAWGIKETVKSDCIFPNQLYDFENVKFYGVAQPDKYLTALYGDYMTLPPEDKRHIHIKGMYKK